MRHHSSNPVHSGAGNPSKERATPRCKTHSSNPGHSGTGSRQRGFTLIEIGVVLGIIGFILVSALVAANSVDNARKVTQAVHDVANIRAGVVRWKAGRSNYSGLTLKALQDRGYLPGNISTGVGENPWGGNYTLATSAGNSSYIISLTSMEDKNHLALSDHLAKEVAGSEFKNKVFALTFN